jgi:hypothetical protein
MNKLYWKGSRLILKVPRKLCRQPWQDQMDIAEYEKTFTEVVLTRLLVRPEAAALYSEVVHSLGRALEEYLILQVCP